MSTSKPFLSCEFCGRVCEFKVAASAVIKAQKTFMIDIFNSIKSTNLGTATKLAMEKSAEVLNQKLDPMSMDQRGMAYCILANAVAELGIDEDSDLVRKLMKAIKKNLVDMLKKSASIDDSEEIENSTEHPTTKDKKIDQETLKKKREMLRAKQSKAFNAKAKDRGVPGQLPIGQQVLDWMRSDSKFMKVVKEIKKVSGGILVNYDPESEGYIDAIKVQFAQKSFNMGNGKDIKTITKLRILAKYDVKYGQDIAIGYGTKKGNKIVVKSFLGGIPKDEGELKLEMREYNPKGIIDQDRLTIILDNDKRLKKIIKHLPINSPFIKKVPDLKVPIQLKHDQTGMQIICTIFFNSRSKPSDIFLGVMDTLAEDLDNLHDIDESVRNKSAKESSLFEINPTSRPNQGFHFITTGGQIDVKTCPNCGRPFPDPKAEYRRCPFCLFKLI